jgi:hypothetical protein
MSVKAGQAQLERVSVGVVGGGVVGGGGVKGVVGGGVLSDEFIDHLLTARRRGD